MGDSDELSLLREKVALLEAENHELLAAGEQASREPGAGPDQGKRQRAWLRSAATLILLGISAMLAPVAVAGNWARTELVETDRFVQLLAPLAQQPEVQSFVAEEVSESITRHLNTDAIVNDLFAGLAETNLPPRAQAALPLLQGAAASGMRTIIDTGVSSAVASRQFASAWEIALRETHSRSIAVIQGDPTAMLQLADDGTLSLDLRAIVAQVRERLVGQGISLATHIPEINRTIPIVSSDSLVLVRTSYQLVTTIGFWLPWIVVGTLALGVLVARNRARALSRAGVAIAATLALQLITIGVAREYFIAMISPATMPVATAEVLFDQLSRLLISTLVALIAMALVLAIAGWLAAASASAVWVREACSRGFAVIRKTLKKVQATPENKLPSEH